jgi:hypothetical protein
MDTKIFRKLIQNKMIGFGFKKAGTSSFILENDELILCITLQKSGYGTLYYLRPKINLKPLKENFNLDTWVKHDFADIISLPDINYMNNESFDLEKEMPDELRIEIINKSLDNFIPELLKNYSTRDSIQKQYKKKKFWIGELIKKKLNLK